MPTLGHVGVALLWIAVLGLLVNEWRTNDRF